MSQAQSIRVSAEWDPHESTWLQWPFGEETSYRPNFAGIIGVLQEYEPVHILVRTTSARTQAQTYLQSAGIPLTNITFHIASYNWAWMRDNGPVYAQSGDQMVVQDWEFDGWGGIVSPWSSDDAVPCEVAQSLSLSCEDHSNLILERGSAEFNGVDTVILSWPVQTSRNPTWTREAQEAAFTSAWGVSKVVWLLSAPSDDVYTGGHVDGIARFIDADTVVVAKQQPGHVDEAVYDEAADILAAAGLEVLRLQIPGEVSYYGELMSANYVNWLVANGVVVMTGFGHAAWDAQAKASIESYFPGRDVRVVQTLELWYWGGGVHCVTNDRPALLPPACPADLDGDANVGGADLGLLLTGWGACGGCDSDLDANGSVDSADLAVLMAAWGPC